MQHESTVPHLRGNRARGALRANAVFSGLSGLALLAGAGPLATALGIHLAIALSLGAGLIAFAAGLTWIVRMPHIPSKLTLLVSEADLVWVIASIVALSIEGSGLTTAGSLAVTLVAVVVATLAAFQMFAVWKDGARAIAGRAHPMARIPGRQSD